MQKGSPPAREREIVAGIFRGNLAINCPDCYILHSDRIPAACIGKLTLSNEAAAAKPPAAANIAVVRRPDLGRKNLPFVHKECRRRVLAIFSNMSQLLLIGHVSANLPLTSLDITYLGLYGSEMITVRSIQVN